MPTYVIWVIGLLLSVITYLLSGFLFKTQFIRILVALFCFFIPFFVLLIHIIVIGDPMPKDGTIFGQQEKTQKKDK